MAKGDEGDILVRETVDKLSRLVNRYGYKEYTNTFISLLHREHRTLQQCIFGLFLQWTYELAKAQEGEYDLRNAATIESAKKIVAALGKYGDNLPFI